MVVKLKYRPVKKSKYLIIPILILVTSFVYLHIIEAKLESAAMIAMDHDLHELAGFVNEYYIHSSGRPLMNNRSLEKMNQKVQEWKSRTFLPSVYVEISSNGIQYLFNTAFDKPEKSNYHVDYHGLNDKYPFQLKIYYNKKEIMKSTGKQYHNFKAMTYIGVTSVVLGILMLISYLYDFYQRRSIIDLDLDDALLDNPEVLKKYIHMSSDFQWLCDLDDNYVKVSSNSQKITGYAASELIGKSIFHFIDRIEADSLKREIKTNREKEEGPVHVLKRFIRKDGQMAYLLSYEIPVSKDGKPAGYWGVDHDITDMQINKYRLELINDLLQAASDIRDFKIDPHDPEKIWRMIAGIVSSRLDIQVAAVYRDIDDELKLASVSGDSAAIIDPSANFINKREFLTAMDNLESINDDNLESKSIASEFPSNFIREEYRKVFKYLKVIPMREEKNYQGFMLLASPVQLGIDSHLGAIIEDILSDTLTRIHLFNYMKEINEARTSLFRNNQFLRNLLDAIPAGVYWKDENGNYLGCNQSFSDAAGLEFPEEILGKRDSDLPWSSNLSGIMEQEKKVVSTGEGVLGYLHRRKLSNGDIRWLNTSLAPLIFHDGKTVGLLGVNSDITAEIKLRDAQVEIKNHLLEKERDLLNAQSMALTGSWSVSLYPDSIKVDWSKALYDLLGLKQKTTYGFEKIIEMVPAEEKSIVESRIQKIIFNYESFSIEHRLIRPDGEIIYVKHSGEADLVRPESVRVCCTVQDITEQVKARELMQKRIKELQDARRATINMMIEADEHRVLAETALKEAEEHRQVAERALIEAENASRVKSKFLSNMRHEIRTPMNSIMGFANILSSSLDDEVLKGYADSVVKSSNSLLKLIEDILTLSTAEAGDLQLKPVITDVRQLVLDSRLYFSDRIKAGNIEYNIHVDDNTPVYIYADENLLKSAVYHLIDNALKFSQFEKVDVRMRNSVSGENLIIEVHDTGPGIPVADQKKIFKGFYKGKKGSELGGTGMGLTLCSSIIKLMNGKIELESEAGKGSTFRIVLKKIEIVKKAQENYENDNFNKRQTAVNKPDLKDYYVLIVDDNETNRELLKAHLLQTSCEIGMAQNGKEAVDLVNNRLPDLIFMDLKMPVMDGYEASRQIRQKSENVKIIMLSGDGSGDIDIDERICDGFLIKPVSTENLYKNINQLFPESSVKFNEAVENKKEKEQSGFSEIKEIPEIRLTPGMSRKLNLLIKKNENSLSFGMDFDALETFSKEIESVARKAKVNCIMSWAEKMQKDLQSYNIAAIECNLRQIKEIAAAG